MGTLDHQDMVLLFGAITATCALTTVGGTILLRKMTQGEASGALKNRVDVLERWKDEHDKWAEDKEKEILGRLGESRQSADKAVAGLGILTENVKQISEDVRALTDSAKETNSKLDDLAGRFSMYLNLQTRKRR